MKKGFFITIEGGEGAGKTTIIKKLEECLLKKNYAVLTTREPGGIRIAEKIRSIILDVSHTEMDGRTEALLYAAARRQHLVEKIIPALKNGYVVICDRFLDSSLAYQGYARDIGFKEILSINEFAIEGNEPDLTLYLDIDPMVGLKRIANDSQREVNRLDKETMQFHQLVREGYQKALQAYPERILLIDANQSLDLVTEDVQMSVINRLSSKKNSDRGE